MCSFPHLFDTTAMFTTSTTSATVVFCQVRDAGSHEMVANVSSPSSSFTVGGLSPGQDYLVLVRTVNTRGISAPYLIHGFALKVAENKISKYTLAFTSIIFLYAFI